MEFESFPKIPRLNRDIVITEKLDGTNACVVFEPDGTHFAQSRNRIITPQSDNYGFAGWVEANRDALFDTLGYGRHFGEWYGAGINRSYGLSEKRFALFNPRWREVVDGRRLGGAPVPSQLDVVPVLYRGPWFLPPVEDMVADTTREWAPYAMVRRLRTEGSVAVPGFSRPEGIVVFHTAAQVLFKATLEGDEKPKGLRE